MSTLIATKRTIMPILEVNDSIDFKFEAQKVLSIILDIIEETEKFGGIPISEPTKVLLKARVVISISLLFKTNKDLLDYVKSSQILRGKI